MTANRVIFAVTVMIRTGRQQNAVRIVFCGSSDGVLPSHCFAAFPEWRSCPWQQRRCLARSTAEVMAEYLIQTVIQLSKAKKKPVYQNQPQRRFRSAEANLMYRPCVLQAPRGLLPICVIQLAHLHKSIVYHIELMFVNKNLYL